MTRVEKWQSSKGKQASLPETEPNGGFMETLFMKNTTEN